MEHQNESPHDYEKFHTFAEDLAVFICRGVNFYNLSYKDALTALELNRQVMIDVLFEAVAMELPTVGGTRVN